MGVELEALKSRLVDLVMQGHSIASGLEKVGRSRKTYELWRREDEGFRLRMDHARAMTTRARVDGRTPAGDFPGFCATYLHQPMFTHQLQWLDLIEGREPRDLHPSMTYQAGEPEKVIVNTPVFHAKSTTLTVNYVTYRICQDPNIRVLIVSKTREMAKKFLYAVKNRLTHPAYRELQVAFAPDGGYKASADAWTTDMIYVGGATRDSGEKDPTVQALGIRGHIYGARADLIILDDAIAQDNAHEYEKQIDWIQAEVESRLSPSGQIIVVGTRVAPADLYAELKNPERYTDGESPWTYLAQPVVLEFAADPADWKTLWPKAQEACQCRQFCGKGAVPPDRHGLYPKWDGPHMAKIRKGKSPRTWALVYMQQQVLEDAIFPPAAVTKAIDGTRQPGPMRPGVVGHRPEGMEGLYVIGGLDPAMSENTAAVVMGVDRISKRRWVLDVFDEKHVTPQAMRDLIKRWTVTYGIHEWRIEKNAFQIMLTQDPEIRDFLASRGSLLREHYTGNNKWDVDFGVASMALLFGQVTKRTTPNGGVVADIEGGLIGLPSTKESEPSKRLVEQLITWAPETKNKTDIVMALWFAEIRAREVCEHGKGRHFTDNRFLGKQARANRVVINLDDYFTAQRGGQRDETWFPLPAGAGVDAG